MKAQYYITAARFVKSQSHWLGFKISHSLYLWLKTRWYVKNFDKHTFGYDITGQNLSKEELYEMSNKYLPDGRQVPIPEPDTKPIVMPKRDVAQKWYPSDEAEAFWGAYTEWFGKYPDRD